MLQLSNSVERMIVDNYKESIQDMLNKIMYAEREEFLEKNDTYAAGFHTRKLQTTIEFNLELKVPKVRKYAKELNYSVFKKYQRNTNEFEHLLKKMYTSRLYESDITDLLSISSISHARKTKIMNEFFVKYHDFIKEEKKASQVIKLDCTYFSSRKAKTKYSVYSVFNCNPDGVECIYYYVCTGNENKAGWQYVINYLVQNVDLSDCKLIVSDMFKALKKILHETKELDHIKKQNCIWHRIKSLSNCVNINKYQKQEFLSDIYSKFLKMPEADYTVFDCFRDFEQAVIKLNNKRQERNINTAINFFLNDNFSFLEVEKELFKYDRNVLLTTCIVESYFSALKFYLKKHRNYSSEKVLITKIMMFIEKENLNKKAK